MPDHCVQCHRDDPEVDIGVLSIQHPAKPFGPPEAPKLTLSRRQYCDACYRRAEQEQHRQQLARLWMALLPMGWFLFSAALIYGRLYPDPATAPIEAHLFFFGTSLAAFYTIPAAIYHRFKRFASMSETFEAAAVDVNVKTAPNLSEDQSLSGR